MIKNKKLVYGILIVVILVIGGVGLFILNKPSTTPTTPETESKDAILSELERLNIEIFGQPKQIQLQLPVTLSDANWGLKKIICEKGGYNLTKYAGEDVLLTSYNINEVYKHTTRFGTEEFPLRVSVITVDNKVACVYKTVREGADLTPGVFSIKDPFVIKK